MKQTVKVLSAVALIFMIAACSKNIETPEVQENNQPEITGGKITESLIAKTENDADTKMAVDGLTSGSTYSWSTGTDKIAAFVTNDDGANYTKVESGAYNGSSFSLTYDEGYERGGFAVYPYEFAKSYSSAGGLVVTYPESYDISDYITNDYLSEKVYDVHSVYFPMPMIATSTSGNSNLEFYSIGAMVRVKVSNIPVGTKVLYITFNQRVTGDFTIASPDPGESVVSATSGTSTVTYRIAAADSEGLDETQAANAIVLYIPVPEATDLSIASTTTTKSTVRNGGKSFAVDAITRATSTTDFKVGSKNYSIAPGNLLATFDSEGNLSGWSFLGGLDQLKTVISSTTNNPHVASGLEPTWGTASTVRDVFTWDRLYEVFMGEDAPTEANISISTDREITVDEKDWRMATQDELAILSGSIDGRDGILAKVKGMDVKFTKVIVQVGGTSYEDYGMTKYLYDGKKCIAGVLLFPDGYVDQTDNIINLGAGNWSFYVPGINYAAFTKMIAAGAVFLPAAGLNDPEHVWKFVDDDSKGIAGTAVYWSATASESLSATAGAFRAHKNIYSVANYNKLCYCSVRLIREIEPDGSGRGQNFTWDE